MRINHRDTEKTEEGTNQDHNQMSCFLDAPSLLCFLPSSVLSVSLWLTLFFGAPC